MTTCTQLSLTHSFPMYPFSTIFVPRDRTYELIPNVGLFNIKENLQSRWYCILGIIFFYEIFMLNMTKKFVFVIFVIFSFNILVFSIFF